MAGYAMFPPELVPEEALETPTEEWDWFFGVCGGIGSAVQPTEEVVAANAAGGPGPTLGGLEGRGVGRGYGMKIPPHHVPTSQGRGPVLDTVQGPIAMPLPLGMALAGGLPSSACLLGIGMEEVAPGYGTVGSPRRPVPSLGDLWGCMEEGDESEDSFLSLPDLLPSGLVEECMLGGGLAEAAPWGGSPALESPIAYPEFPSLDSVWGSSSTVGHAMGEEDVWAPDVHPGIGDPQLPSLRSVFGTCEGSHGGGVPMKDGCMCQPSGHGLPSLHSIFGTCGGLEEEEEALPHQLSPQLPSLRSVFGSCGGVDEELVVAPESPGCSEGTAVSFEALGFEEILPDDTDGSWSRAAHVEDVDMGALCPGVKEEVHLVKVHGAAIPVGACLPPPPPRTVFGTYAVASPAAMSLVARQGGREGSKLEGLKKRLALAEGCTTMLRDQCQDPLFDAQWNVIGMINSLMADPLAVAVDVLNGTTHQGSQVFYEILEHVIAVPRQHIFEMRRLGEGAYGFVSLSCCPGLGEVAVKWFKSEEGSSQRPELQHECALLAELPRHENLLEFMGLVKQSSDSNEIVGYISEFCDMGTLSKYSRRKGVAPSFEERITMALQIARGMAILHRNNICHFDLKPENILLVQNSSSKDHPHVRIGDFGLARRLVEGYIKSPGALRGTLPYLSPEMATSTPLVDARVDVWAFGAVLCEMATLEVPYRGYASEEILMGLQEGNLKPSVPEWVEPEYKHLVDSCLEYHADRRPHFEQIVEYLEGLCMEKGWHVH
ncbi:hypothetical protein BSKO_13333 [Bryopsis sp. KO-2023]|nr:hypothetical protein BSKO_13333 [Bryopsis sp. KO-2023]